VSRLQDGMGRLRPRKKEKKEGGGHREGEEEKESASHDRDSGLRQELAIELAALEVPRKTEELRLQEKQMPKGGGED